MTAYSNTVRKSAARTATRRSALKKAGAAYGTLCALVSLSFSLPTRASAQSVPIGFVTAVHNPEDLVQLPGTPWVVVSAMRSENRPGMLFTVDTRQPDAAISLYPASAAISDGPQAATFAPHGIDARRLSDGRFELLVVDHGNGEAIDRFVVRADEGQPPVVESVSRIELPPSVWANGIAAVPDGFVVTSMFDPRDPTFVRKFGAAEVTGSIWRWSQATGWRQIGQDWLSGANGIAVSAGADVIFVSEWAARRIWRIPLDGGKARFTTVPFLPDNLRWTDEGTLLVAGQTATPQEVFNCEAESRPCPMGFVVARIDPEALAVQPILTGDEPTYARTGFGGATGAIKIGETIWVGSFTGRRVARFTATAFRSEGR